jgi:hypothetical protein
MIRTTISQLGTGVTSVVIRRHSKRCRKNDLFFWSSLDLFGPFSRTADRIAAPPTGMDRGRYGACICGASRVLRVEIDVGTCENVISDEKNAIFPESFAAAPLNENMLPGA